MSVFCERTNCYFNENGLCENCGNISLDETGTCTDYDNWYELDDIEQSEVMAALQGGEQE